MSYDISEDEVKQIANSFLLAAPPGEFMEVVSDVRGLLTDDSIINDTAPSTFREWNTDQMLQVQSPNGDHQVLITKFGEVNDSEYIDPRGRVVIQFDHIRQQVAGHRSISNELDNSVEDFRSAFDDAAQDYVGDHFMNGGATVYGQKKGDHIIRVAISSSKFNASNYWNGRWRSIWTCTFKPGSGQISIEGTIRTHIHYFENGNVQLVTNTNKSDKCNSGDPQTAAANALKSIARLEGEFQTALAEIFTSMGDTTFKALRRVLPLTREPIKWEKISTYKLQSSR